MHEVPDGEAALERARRYDAAAIVTDRDLTVSVLADGRDGGDRIEDHASSPVVTARLDMNVEEAAKLMIANGIRRLPIIDGDRLTGIVTLDDIVLRTAHPEATLRMTTDITRAALPEFYFLDRDG